jgi:hypothetical protein
MSRSPSDLEWLDVCSYSIFLAVYEPGTPAKATAETPRRREFLMRATTESFSSDGFFGLRSE